MTGPASILLQPLCDLPTGVSGVIRQFRGGGLLSARLAALGFSVGAPVTVIMNIGRGPLIVSLRGSRLALGRGEAGQVFAEVTRAGGS
jgi:ferrous iron transport protein A